MNRSTYRTLTLLLFLLSIGMAVSAFSPAPASKSDKATKKLKSLVFYDLEEKPYTLDSFAGKYIVLDVWASWCAPCFEEKPYMKKVQAEFADRSDIVWLFLSVDRDETAWADAVARDGLHGVHLRLPAEDINALKEALNTTTIPYYALFDKTGKISIDPLDKPSDRSCLKVLRTALK